MKELLTNFLIFLIILGFIPTIALLIQFLLVGVHGVKNHYNKCKPYTPKVAIIIPVWNEEEVITNTIETLMRLEYPKDQLRIYAVDDVSTDNTPEVLNQMVRKYPDNVINLRRPEKIDFGKAAVINFGLENILQDSWAEAIMIIDADVLFEPDSLIKMTRHLADPEVNAVTAYIKEGQIPGNYITHCVAFEYIVAQAATRRAQEVYGVMACLAGGAQLHKRENIHLIGGRIDTSTLAEDTITTFMTQLNHKKVIFEGNAVAISEEPGTITDLWKQRFRWAEGNIQITRKFKNIWFRRKTPGGMGGIFFGIIWFSTMLMPISTIIVSIVLNILYFFSNYLTWDLFRIFSLLNLFAYFFTTFYSFAIDPGTAKRAWFAGLMFPGLLSLFNMFVALAPRYFEILVRHFYTEEVWRVYEGFFMLWLNSWIALCMLCAWIVVWLDKNNVPQRITNALLVLVGYGPLLCTITLAATFKQLFNREMTWNKTQKTGKVQRRLQLNRIPYDFKNALAHDKKVELRLFFYEIFIIVVLILLVCIARYYGFTK